MTKENNMYDPHTFWSVEQIGEPWSRPKKIKPVQVHNREGQVLKVSKGKHMRDNERGESKAREANENRLVGVHCNEGHTMQA